MKTRILEGYGIYISIVFSRNMNREPAWRFVIETIEDQLIESGRFYDYEECEREAIKKAVEYLP